MYIYNIYLYLFNICLIKCNINVIPSHLFINVTGSTDETEDDESDEGSDGENDDDDDSEESGSDYECDLSADDDTSATKLIKREEKMVLCEKNHLTFLNILCATHVIYFNIIYYLFIDYSSELFNMRLYLHSYISPKQ